MRWPPALLPMNRRSVGLIATAPPRNACRAAVCTPRACRNRRPFRECRDLLTKFEPMSAPEIDTVVIHGRATVGRLTQGRTQSPRRDLHARRAVGRWHLDCSRSDALWSQEAIEPGSTSEG